MSRLTHHLPVLEYHRIGEPRPDHVPTVSTHSFERQMAWLARWRYRVMALDDVAQAMERGAPVPRWSAVITFDDGYEDNYTVAWPILKRFGFPAIVFVTPTEVGLPGFATWEQLARMAADGFAVGSHTMHHAYIPATPEARLMEELAESKRMIEERIGRRVDFLSYPIGGYTPRAQAVARDAGYRAACTTNRGTSFALADRYAIRRIKMSERDRHPLLLGAKLSGYYDLFRALKRPG